MIIARNSFVSFFALMFYSPLRGTQGDSGGLRGSEGDWTLGGNLGGNWVENSTWVEVHLGGNRV